MTCTQHGYAAVDIFTCNMDADIGAGVDAMKRHFLPGRTQIMEVRRGLQD
jgi:S-adenosylmethionine/arginine decarboxylase-like enzyme